MRAVIVGVAIQIFAVVAMGYLGAQFPGVPWIASPWILVALILLGMAIILNALVRETLLWLSRRYTLSADRMTATSGILSRTRVEIPLRNIQQVALDQTVGERVLGLGTILVTSAGSQTIDLAWVSISRPHERLGMVRGAMSAAVPMPVWLEEKPGSKPLVLGLVGGIGAGKSLVARTLAEMGFVVVDSDKEAKAALDRPEVREALVNWWGPTALDASGRVDRKRVAEIVFADPAQRTRLEALIHPLVKVKRGEMIARAAAEGVAEGVAGVVVDAPLLFEAGVDAECDAVMFVEAPVAAREERVRARGWDSGELRRRENAQIPLEEKRRRSDISVVNDSTPEVLRERVAAAVQRLRSQPTRAARKDS